jgi:hypothetical protein
VVDDVLLPCLAEGQPIDRERVAEALQSIELPAEREGEDVALDFRAVLDRVDPVWDEFRVGLEPVVACEPKRGCPRVSSIGSRAVAGGRSSCESTQPVAAGPSRPNLIPRRSRLTGQLDPAHQRENW